MSSDSKDDLPGDVTRLLQEWHDGSETATDRLFSLVDAELHAIAHRRMQGERLGHTMQAPDLVNEVVRKLLPGGAPNVSQRAQFFQLIARAMRNVLVDHARKRNADKRGGGAHRLGLTGLDGEAPREEVDLLPLHAAPRDLERVDPRQAKIIQMKFFAGMSNEDAAEALGVSVATVKREWATAREWLKAKLELEG